MFTILLPAVMGLSKTPVDVDSTTDNAPCSGTVLVVEDHDDVRAIICETLRDHGLRVLSARDGRHALQLAAQESAIDLLLTDVVMPEMDGTDLADTLLRSRTAMRVVFMTGYPSPPNRMDSWTTREHVMLRKPFSPSTLTKVVQQVLNA